MITRKEAFKKILNLLFEETQPATETTVEVNLTEIKTIDGMILQYEGDFIEGVSLNVIDEAGVITPIADGEYELEDGTKITTVGGLVTMIEPKTETPAETTAPEEETIEEMSSDNVKFNELTTKITELETKLAAYETKFNEMLAKNESKFSAISESIKLIADEPATTSEPVKNVLFSKVDKANANDLIKEYLNWRNK